MSNDFEIIIDILVEVLKKLSRQTIPKPFSSLRQLLEEENEVGRPPSLIATAVSLAPTTSLDKQHFLDLHSRLPAHHYDPACRPQIEAQRTSTGASGHENQTTMCPLRLAWAASPQAVSKPTESVANSQIDLQQPPHHRRHSSRRTKPTTMATFSMETRTSSTTSTTPTRWPKKKPV